MNATSLLADLQRRGVVLFTRGTRLRYRAPRGVLGTADLVDLRHHKEELLRLLDCPAAHLDRAWGAAYRQVQTSSAEHGTEPTEATLQGAAKILLDLEQDKLAHGIDADLAQELLEELYAGQSAARIGADGRVVLWSVPSGQPRGDGEGSA